MSPYTGPHVHRLLHLNVVIITYCNTCLSETLHSAVEGGRGSFDAASTLMRSEDEKEVGCLLLCVYLCSVCECVHACVSFLYRYNPLCPELVLECYHTVSMLLQYVCEHDVCCVLVYYCIHLDVCKWGQSKLVTLVMTFYLYVCMLAVGVSLLLHCCGSEKGARHVIAHYCPGTAQRYPTFCHVIT